MDRSRARSISGSRRSTCSTACSARHTVRRERRPEMPERKLIKVRLHDRNADSESVWAFDLGPAKGKRGARRVQINSICFMHAKPTLHDVIVVEPDPEDDDYLLQWDRRGVPFGKVGSRIAKD